MAGVVLGNQVLNTGVMMLPQHQMELSWLKHMYGKELEELIEKVHIEWKLLFSPSKAAEEICKESMRTVW